MSFENKNVQLYEGSEKDGERFIIFATPRYLNIFSLSSNIYSDSTFKSVSEIFSQCLLFTKNTKIA
ncbi:hypothetical protein HZS_6303 [Henneguya salminicola]|nr:hypothetical protein HZS_6303 [Henneguya salminicola]